MCGGTFGNNIPKIETRKQKEIQTMQVTIQVDVATDKVKDVHDMVDRVYAAKAKATTTAKPAADKKAAETKPAETTGPVNDRNAVKDALKSLAQLAGKEDAVKILNDNGAASISELDESKFDVVHAAAVKAVAEYVPPAEDAEPDEFD